MLRRFPSEDVIKAIFERNERVSEIERRVAQARDDKNLGAHFLAIRELYEINQDSIKRGEYEPYLMDWSRLFTPIEDMAWQSIRYYGIPMYPQYPVGRFFVDFGDPVKKIAIECDGKQWHHDKEKDRKRDTELFELGWITFRVTGSEANNCCECPADAHARGADEREMERVTRQWAFNNSEGVIGAIAMSFYGQLLHHLSVDDCLLTLDKHRLASFPVEGIHLMSLC